jgi:histidinol dehydrogenase
MNIIRYPERQKWPEILKRPGLDRPGLEENVKRIIHEVVQHGDRAVRSLTKQFDGADIGSLEVPPEEISSAAEKVDDRLKRAIGQARRNIMTFHMSQVQPAGPVVTEEGVRCWQKPVPINTVGLYVPGGSAPLLSTALMLGIPARIAGCNQVILCTPPGKDGSVHPSILYVAGLLEVDRVFRVGGVQAIAAMAYGTESIPAVHKIFGPGNQYVTMAKQVVSRDQVAIDLPAGPSELAVVADKNASPAFIASDLLSQAEHGPDSQVLLLTDSEALIGKVQKEIRSQLDRLPRKEIAAGALQHSKMILLEGQKEIMEMVNSYAPEHLIIVTGNYADLAGQVTSAGSVFLGEYTPESAGDYVSGTNHTLPTHGWARAYSGVNMDSYYKKITFQEISSTGLRNIGDAVIAMAEAEQLRAHSNAVSIRLNSQRDER